MLTTTDLLYAIVWPYSFIEHNFYCSSPLHLPLGPSMPCSCSTFVTTRFIVLVPLTYPSH